MNISITPRTLTIITTYRCTAACEDCCFECNPNIEHELTLEEIKESIDRATAKYPSIELVVFSGGECFMLKEKLFDAIGHCSQLGLLTRCVTNAYWGKTPNKAISNAEKLLDAGITEINISTGLDHQRWVNESTVINAAKALLEKDITTLITVEKDTIESNCLHSINSNPELLKIKKDKPGKLKVISNTWMPFFTNSKIRGYNDSYSVPKGCGQVFDNIVVTPKREIAACCGLTLEHIPEMKLCGIDEIEKYAELQHDDFLKLWLRVDGPERIIQLIQPGHVKKFQHPCQACAVLHLEEETRKSLIKNYQKHISSVIYRWNLGQAKEAL